MSNVRGQYGAPRFAAQIDRRGQYSTPLIGGEAHHGSSLVTWILGGLAVGGAALWAKHQSDQISQLYKATGLPHQGFVAHVRSQTRELSTAARAKIHRLTQPSHVPARSEP